MTMDRSGNNVKEVLFVDAVDVDVDVSNGTIYYINNTDSQVFETLLLALITRCHFGCFWLFKLSFG